MVLQKKERWQFESRVGYSWSFVGINEIVIPFEDFANVKETLIALVQKGQSVFIWIDNGSVTHSNDYDPALSHSLLVTGYVADKDEFILEDIPSYTNLHYEYSTLKKGCNASDIKYLSYLSTEHYQVSDHKLDVFKEKFLTVIKDYTDDFAFYDKLIVHLEEVGSDYQTHMDVLHHLDDSIAIIAGSRLLFLKYLKRFNLSNDAIALCSEILKIFEFIKVSLSRFMINGKLNRETNYKRIYKVKNLELEMYSLLKNSFSKVNHLVHGNKKRSKTVFPPNEVYMKAATDTSITVAWNQPEEDTWINSYVLFKNGDWFADVEKNQLIVPNLVSETTYEFSVKSKSIFGDFSESSSSVLLSTTEAIKSGDLAKNRAVYSSSEENQLFSKENIVDGNTDTRWSSDPAEETSWIYVDLGSLTAFTSIKLTWEDAYAKKYVILISEDASDWTEVAVQHIGQGGEETIKNLDCTARYIKVLALTKATIYGYSLWNLSVYCE
ncbi:discoidin domain-containing protein [Paenibacillus sp. L3-i20]|uniref:discoidin domain-containing protein n=1 Tax=Paenibacillus sp. L3-i20 TaxID=2905833 RepID=UPI0020BE8176|nr:discoidin domain-containing protein [Paenibacillus sp. L3-i20]